MNTGKILYHLNKLIFEDLQEFNGFAIAGGCIRDMFVGEKIKDYDMFFDSEESALKVEAWFDSMVANNKATKMPSNDRLVNYRYKDKWFQLIKSNYWQINSSALIDDFDFTICQAMVRKNSDGPGIFSQLLGKQPNTITIGEIPLAMTVGEYFFEDCLSKHLRINKILFPYNTLERMQKYIKKGYTACRGTISMIGDSFKTTTQHNFLRNTDLRFYGID